MYKIILTNGSLIITWAHDEHADFAEHWVLSLSKSGALLKASVFSKNFWLQAFVK
jgi:hypothetical protein